jgi:hypothetical protein
MNSAKPSDDKSAALRRLIEAGARVRPLSDRDRRLLLARMKQRVDTGTRRRENGLVPLAVISSLLAAWLLHASIVGETPPRWAETPSGALRPPPSATHSILLGGRGEIALDQGAVARFWPSVQGATFGPQAVELRSGRLTADVGTRGPDEPLSIVTPQVVVIVVGTRFSVAVVDGVTTVHVEHGRVRVEHAGRAAFVDAGETLQSDDARLTAPESADQTPLGPKSKCCRAGRVQQATRGNGLAAENALLSRALLERDERGDGEGALARLREYERRFPDGALRREVALTMATTLVGQGRRGDACAYAERYRARFPTDSPTLARLLLVCGR